MEAGEDPTVQGFLGEERLVGQDVAGCVPRQPGVRHTWRRGQSSRGHLPLLKFRHTSLVRVGVVCLGPAVVTLGFLAGPLEEKRGHSEGEWEEVRQWSHHALGRAFPDPVKALV